MQLLSHKRSVSSDFGPGFGFFLRLITFHVIVVMPLLLTVLLGVEPSYSVTAEASSDAWHIVADTLTYDDQTQMFIAEGNVLVSRDDESIQADYLEYDRMLNSAFARGNVVLQSRGGDQGSAERALIDMKTGTGTLYGGSIFIETSHLYIKGDKINKIGEQTFTADKVSVTSCDGDNPDWKFTGRNLNVTIEGYGTVFHAAFWARKLPLLYSPFLVFPVKLKRQTGFLAPQLAQSDRKGTEYLQPFFWAINDSHDATIYNRYMTERGNMTGGEYRYMLDAESKGTMMVDYLNDNEIDDGSEESTGLWGYDDSVARTNAKRYWIRTKHNQKLPDGSTLKFDTDIVSDQDYLREFSSMKNGYDSSKSDFTANYGRDLELEDDYIRTNSLIYTKAWTSYSLNASAYWYDNIVNRRMGYEDKTLQKLPTIDFTASRHRILDTPLYYDLDSEYTYFFRDDVTETLRRGQRADLYPRLIFPWGYKNWFSLESTVGYRQTYWYIEDEPDLSDDLNDSHYRKIHDVKVDLSTNVYRIFNTGGENTDKIKHTFTPKLTYAYTPDRDQTKYPKFDALDSLSRVNTLTLTLDNSLTSRTKIVTPDQQTALSPPKYSYRQFCRFKLQQVYDMNEAQETDPGLFINKESREPFLPLYGEIEILPCDYMSFEADAKWSHYDRHLTEGNLIFKLMDKRGDVFRIEQRYTLDTVKYLNTYGNLVITDAFSVYGENERNLIDREDIKTSTGLIYTSQCWGIQLDYSHKPNDKRYMLTFSLKGLGEFGTRYNADREQ